MRGNFRAPTCSTRASIFCRCAWAAPLFWKMQSNLQLTYSPRDYIDQHVVVLSGGTNAHAAARHVDRIVACVWTEPSTSRRPSNCSSNLQYAYSTFDSNQNHYDARVTTFIPDYYDYWGKRHRNAADARVREKIGAGPMLFDLGYNYTYRAIIARASFNPPTERLT